MTSTIYANESIPSDDGGDAGEPRSSSTSTRGTRACDRCRKIKSKCEPTSSDRCKNCETAGTPCTYHGPSFKRGPPKGYIHAIEQRWHQVESVLATITASPRAEAILSDLRGDPLARNILDRVDSGPYGLHGRHQSGQATGDTLYATIMGDHSVNEDRRARRQSRLTRENVSIEDPSSFATPTQEWQQQLSRRLAGIPASPYPTPLPSHASPAAESMHYDFQNPNLTFDIPDPQRRTRRRLYVVSPSEPSERSAWSSSPQHLSDDREPSDSKSGFDDATDSFGHLSLDDEKEIHYYGQASGLPLLAKSDRAHIERQAGTDGLWHFTNPKQEHISPPLRSAESESVWDDRLPYINTNLQVHLVDVYFTYVHPFFPVLHKQHFLDDFNQAIRRSLSGSARPSTTQRVPMQRVCKELLLAMYSVASRYSYGQDHNAISSDEYASNTRQILSKMYHISRPSTCQALLLLGYREFGMGSMEQGWLYSGLALRMAVDLGMNRNADRWTEDSTELFSADDKQTRKQIWWSCCMTDKLSSMWLGRPVMFRANDFTTPRPDILPQDEDDLWQPFPADALGTAFRPTPSRVLSTFWEACNLSTVIIEIMDQIYSVSPLPERQRRGTLASLESRLQKWLIGLPDHLRYSPGSAVTPLPHILTLHMEYYAATLLLHRAFLPQLSERTGTEPSILQADRIPSKSFDICQNTAAQISSIATVYDEKYGLNRAPPFLSIYLQSAGIMHVITLKKRPQNMQASIGLRQCVSALKRMENLWPSAVWVRELLEGAAVQLGQMQGIQGTAARPKRNVETAFGPERPSNVVEREAFGQLSQAYQHPQAMGQDQGLAHTLGLDVPGPEPPMSFYPDYQWWPRPSDQGSMYAGFLPTSVPDPSITATSVPPAPMDNFTWDMQDFPGEGYRSTYSSLDPQHVFRDNTGSQQMYRGPIG